MRDPEPSVAAHLLPKYRVMEQLCDGIREGYGIARWNEQTGNAGLDGIAGASGGGGNDGQRGCGGLQSNIGKTFAMGRQDEDIHGAIKRGNLGAKTRNDDGWVGQDALHDVRRKMVFRSIEPTAEEQPELRVLDAKTIESLKQLGDALVACETTDVAKNKSIGRNAAGGARRFRTGNKLIEINTVCAAVGEHLQPRSGSDVEPGSLHKQAGTVTKDDVRAGGSRTFGKQ